MQRKDDIFLQQKDVILPEHDGHPKGKLIEFFIVFPFVELVGWEIPAGYRFLFLVALGCRKQQVAVVV